MLGTRTRQVNTYGKRSRRTVNASEQQDIVSSVSTDTHLPQHWAPLASRMKKRENAATKPAVLFPKTVRIHKRKHSSSLLQPILKDSRTSSPASPARNPFSPVPVNIPRSPARLPKDRRKKAPFHRVSLTPINPTVDIDIIVLDDDGQTVAKERRVSRTAIEVNPINHMAVRMKTTSHLATFDSVDDEQSVLQVKRPKRRAALTVYSDDSDSEDDARQSKTSPRAHWSRLDHATVASRTIVEVVVPPAPYRIHSVPAKTSASSTQQALFSLPPHAGFGHPLSPVGRPRQLTPIKGGTGKKFFDPLTPPSPCSIDFDLSLELDGLSLQPSTLERPMLPEFDVPRYLHLILRECYQEETGPADFSSFIEAFAFDPVVNPPSGRPLDLEFRKIGEASYSEVFGVGQVVLKIIPLRDETAPVSSDDGDSPFTSYVSDVLREIVVTRALGEMCQGFVELLKTYIVRGKYPEVLLRLWDEYHGTKGSESVRPDGFLVTQCYAIIVLPNGGPDLETYKFVHPAKTGWRQASSLFWQVAKSLAFAEQLVSFEHRDLHWGQILVKNLPVLQLSSKNQNSCTRSDSVLQLMDDPIHGVQATLIDLGLARMDAGDGINRELVYWTPFDEEIFMGEGDYQFDIYRIMRHHIGGDWEGFKPLTNVFWLHYLLTKLLYSKGLKVPGASSKLLPGDLGQFTEVECYECLVAIEKWLGGRIDTLTPRQLKRPKAKGRPRKTQIALAIDLDVGLSCAGDVVAFGVKKGWIQSAS